ncbi:MAG: VanZ family protein [Proteobacteria bacterium]|nr:VanZ family protein [Pseudomonadota bacterium]
MGKAMAVVWSGRGRGYGFFRELLDQGRQRARLFMATALLVGAPFFFWGAPEYLSPRSLHAAWDLGHFLYFLVFTCWAHDIWRKKGKPTSSFPFFAAMFTLVLLLGTTVEFMQMLVDGRSPDIFDVLRNQLGCLTAFAFFIRPRLFGLRWRQAVLQVGVFVLLGLAAWPLARALFDESAARLQFPVLTDFETMFECDRWNNGSPLRLTREYVRHGSQAARLELSTDAYSGIALIHFPRDWSGYQTLHFSVYNPDAAQLKLNTRIHDIHHRAHGMEYQDRFHQAFTLVPGWNDLVIALDKVKASPEGRTMDMEHIEGFGLFVVRQPRPQVIYLDHIYLDR